MRLPEIRASPHRIASLGSHRLTPEQVVWVIIGLLVALFAWLLISGETMAGRGWT